MSQIRTTPRQEIALLLELRKTLTLRVVVEAKDGTPYDLTGAKAVMGLGVPPSVTLAQAADLSRAESGIMDFIFQAVDLDYPLRSGPTRFDITMMTAEGYVVVLAKGDVEWVDNTERDISLDPDTAEWLPYANQPAQQITLTLSGRHVVKMCLDSFPYPRIQLGSVHTLPPGEPARAEMHGQYPLQTVELWMPEGQPGLDGIQGPQGPPGPPGNEALLRLDTDGVPYFIPDLLVPGASVQLDTDGVPYLSIGV